MLGQAAFFMGLQLDVAVDVACGALQKGVDQVLVHTSCKLLNDLVLCLGWKAYGVHVPATVGEDHDAGMGMVAAPIPCHGCGHNAVVITTPTLLLQLLWARRLPLVMGIALDLSSCCNGHCCCCCHSKLHVGKCRSHCLGQALLLPQPCFSAVASSF